MNYSAPGKKAYSYFNKLHNDIMVYLEDTINVLPYVWHVSYPEMRDDISRFGLLPVNGLLFANNQYIEMMRMFPFCFEGPSTSLKNHDFWRIDTRACGANWYIDPNMRNDAPMLDLNVNHYICTPDAIAPMYLKRYEYNMWKKDFLQVSRQAGSANLRIIKRLPLSAAA